MCVDPPAPGCWARPRASPHARTHPGAARALCSFWGIPLAQLCPTFCPWCPGMSSRSVKPLLPCRIGLCHPISILGCGDAPWEGCAWPQGLPLEKIHLPMIHLPSCGTWTRFGSMCSCLVVALVLFVCFFCSSRISLPLVGARRMFISEDGLGERPRHPALGPNLQLFYFPHSNS